MHLWGSLLLREKGGFVAWKQLLLNQSTFLQMESLCPRGGQNNIPTSFSMIHLLITNPIFLASSHGRRIYFYSMSHPFFYMYFCFSLDYISPEDDFPLCPSLNYRYHKKKKREHFFTTQPRVKMLLGLSFIFFFGGWVRRYLARIYS